MSECAESRVSPDELPKRRTEISFGGCGFMGVYHAGVGKCVCDHAPQLFGEFDNFYGASAGSISAVFAACRCDPMEAYKWVKKTFEVSRKHKLGMFHPSFDLYKRLRDFLNDYLPKKAHRMCRGKVEISLTTFSDRGLPVNWLVSDFNTRKELINAVIASSFIPVYAGLKDLPKFRGKRCCDGGMSSNIPHLSNPDVITVSPFSGPCDISPKESSYLSITLCDQPFVLTMANSYRLATCLCPTSWEQLERMFTRGYEDAKSFFQREGYFSTPIPSPPSTPTPMTESTSKYYSTCSHTRSLSMAVSVSADFVSCADEEEEEDRQVFELVPKRQPSYIAFDVPRQRSVVGGILRSPISAVELSLKSFSRMLQTLSSSKLSALHQFFIKKKQTTWEGQVSDRHSGLLGSVFTTMAGSMLTF